MDSAVNCHNWIFGGYTFGGSFYETCPSMEGHLVWPNEKYRGGTIRINWVNRWYAIKNTGQIFPFVWKQTYTAVANPNQLWSMMKKISHLSTNHRLGSEFLTIQVKDKGKKHFRPELTILEAKNISADPKNVYERKSLKHIIECRKKNSSGNE